MPLRAACLCAFALATACAAPSAVEVDAAAEQVVSGPLGVSQAHLSASAEGQRLRLRVPVESWLPGPVAIHAAVRGLHGELLGSADAVGRSGQTTLLLVPAGGPLRDLGDHARRVLHLRVSQGPYEVRIRRSLLALVTLPAGSVELPRSAEEGAAVPFLVAVRPAGASASIAVGAGVALGQDTVAGGVSGLLPPVAVGGVDVDVVLRAADGTTRHLPRALQVVPRPLAYLVRAAVTAGPDQAVGVLVVPAPPPGSWLRLLEPDGRARQFAPVSTVGTVGAAQVVVPGDVVRGEGSVALVVDGIPVASTPVGMVGRALEAARLGLEWAEVGARTRMELHASDVWGRPMSGQVRFAALHGGLRTLDGTAPLADGRASVEARTAALLAGPGGGALAVTATVIAEDGGAATLQRMLFLGGAGLEVQGVAAPCVAGGGCAVDVLVSGMGGTPVSAEVLVQAPGTQGTVRTAADGYAQAWVPALEPGRRALQLRACDAGGACGTAVVLQDVAAQGPLDLHVGGPVLVQAGVETRWWMESTGGRAGLLTWLAAPGTGLTGEATLAGGARFVDGPPEGSATLHRPGIYWLHAAVLDDSGIVATGRRVVVTPALAAGPAMVLGGGRAQVVAPGAVVAAGWTCGGASELGSAWQAGALGASGAGWLRVDPARGARMSPAALAAAVSTAPVETAALEPDVLRARAELEARVAEDLEAVAAEARALVAEGSLTTTGLGAWLERRRAAYVDTFGQRYLLWAESGRLKLRGRGPDEVSDTDDDVEAQVPMERLVSAAAGDPPDPAVADPPDPAVEVNSPAVRWAAAPDEVDLPEPPACPGHLRVVAAAVRSDGAVGTRDAEVAATGAVPTWTAVAPRRTVGDSVLARAALEGAGQAAWRVEGPGVLHTARVDAAGAAQVISPTGEGTVTAALEGDGRVLSSSATGRVLPAAPALPTTRVTLCPASGPCAVDLPEDSWAWLWGGAADACSRGLEVLRGRPPPEAAGLALAAAEAGDDLAFQRAWPEALEAAAATAAARPAVVEAALAFRQRRGHDPAGPMAAWTDGVLAGMPAVPGVSPRLASAWQAWIASRAGRPHAAGSVRAVLQAAASADDAASAAWALAALAAEGAATAEDEQRVLAAGPADGWSRAGLARFQLLKGNRAAAEAVLASTGELLGAPAPPHQQARAAAAWCALGTGAPPSGTPTATDAAGAVLPVARAAGGWGFRAAGPGPYAVSGAWAWAVDATVPVVGTVGPMGASWSQGAVGDILEVGLPASHAEDWWFLEAPPGFGWVAASLPQGRAATRREGGWWVRGGAVFTVKFRAREPVDALVPHAALWTPHLGALPTVATGRRVRVR
ncbi:MAG: hypothetical protein HY904_25530 [Deltaproteobacteria bacterium]|nr:hypothetical protein [Deltaproteobacteria bacterium]